MRVRLQDRQSGRDNACWIYDLKEFDVCIIINSFKVSDERNPLQNQPLSTLIISSFEWLNEVVFCFRFIPRIWLVFSPINPPSQCRIKFAAPNKIAEKWPVLEFNPQCHHPKPQNPDFFHHHSTTLTRSILTEFIECPNKQHMLPKSSS